MEMESLQSLEQWMWPMLLLALWTLPWKGVALWKASKNNQKVWFVIILIANTLAILEIIYIIFFSKKKPKEEDIIHTALNI